VLAIALCAAAGVSLAVRRWGHEAGWNWRSREWKDQSASLERARAYLERGEAPRAIRALSAIKPGSPFEPEALTIRGLALGAIEETGPARQVLERAWRLRPSGDAARVLAAIYLSANENERGLQMLIEASRLDPADFRPWYAMGESVYLRLRRYDLAAEAFRESLKRLPSHIQSSVGLADALLKSHHYDEAARLLGEILKQRPDDPRVRSLAAEVALASGDDQEAARHVAHALSIEPDHHDALVLHARLLFGQRRRHEALPVAEHALRLDPNNISTLTLLSSIQASLGLRGEAERTLARKREIQQLGERIERLQKEILESPQAPEPRFHLGQVAARAELIPLAVQSYQAALAQAPDFEPARKALLDLGFPASKLPPSFRTQRSGSAPRARAKDRPRP
jgi:tetratricopeptide (TPR) repeat protein